MTGASKSANKGSGDSLLSKSNTNTRLRTKVDMPEPTPDDVHRIGTRKASVIVSGADANGGRYCKDRCFSSANRGKRPVWHRTWDFLRDLLALGKVGTEARRECNRTAKGESARQD